MEELIDSEILHSTLFELQKLPGSPEHSDKSTG